MSGHTHARPLWLLPLACAVLPFAAAWIAFALSAQAGYIEACNPFWDGCTSISRAARHGAGNQVFRSLVLPTAVLQIVFWWCCRSWLRQHGYGRGRGLRELGLLAGLALILYAWFLGSDGAIYQLLRRYGVTIYFAATYLALLAVLRQLARRPRDRAYAPLLTIALVMLGLGLISTAVSATVTEPALRDRLENVLEWQLGLWQTALFATFAWRWREPRAT